MSIDRTSIKLKSFDHRLIDASAREIVDTARRSGARIFGPIPLPTRKERFAVLISPHVNKDARDQYEVRVHKRLIEIETTGQTNTADALNQLNLPAGVHVRISISRFPSKDAAVATDKKPIAANKKPAASATKSTTKRVAKTAAQPAVKSDVATTKKASIAAKEPAKTKERPAGTAKKPDTATGKPATPSKK